MFLFSKKMFLIIINKFTGEVVFSKFQSSKRLALDFPTLGSKLAAERTKNKWCYLVSGLINGFQTSSASLITFEIASSGSG